MASDNYTPPGSGITFRSTSDGTLQWPVGVTSYATTVSAGANALQVVTPTFGLPVQPQTGSTWAVTQSGSWAVSVSGTVPISAASLPLPAGAATAANQATANGYLQTLATNSPTLVGGSVPVAGTFWQATQPVSAASLPLPTGAATDATLSTLSGKVTACNTGAVVLAAGSAVIGHAIIDSGTVTANIGTTNGLALDATLSTLNGKVTACNTGAVTISAALPAGANLLGKVGIDQTTPGTTNAVQVVAGTTGGATPYSYIAAANTNQDSQAIKSSAGTLYSLVVMNTVSALRYLKVYNKAAPTSADTPVLRIPVPANGGTGAGVAFPIPAQGVAFGTAIGFRMTTGQADGDATAVTAGDLVVSAVYQ